jgi:uncharacterized protein
MHFIILAYDFKDAPASDRRLAARDQHIKMIDFYKEKGNMILGTPILDDSREKMIGSMIVCDFDSEAELQQWLKNEPYVVNKVWETIEIKPCNIGPSFLNDNNLRSTFNKI